MSDGLRRLGSYRRSAMLLLAAGMAFSTVGCGSVPNMTVRSFDAMPGFGSKAKQRAFEQQVENDPFPTARKVGL
ncbi:MAG: hypothetical protein V3R99_05490 [Thermoguttaceae bacterium]